MQIAHHHFLVGQRNFQRRNMRVLNDKLVEVVYFFRQQNGHDIRMKDGRIVGPTEDFYDICAEWSAELNRISSWDDEFRKIDNHSDLVGFASPYRLEVQRAQQVAVDQFESSTRFARLNGGCLIAEYLLQPFSPVFGSFRQTYSSAAIVLEHDIVALEHDVLEKCLQRQQPPACRICRGDNIKDVSVNQKLSNRAGPEKVTHLFGPYGQLIRHCDSF